MHVSRKDIINIPNVCKRWQWISKRKLSLPYVKCRNKVDEDIETSAGLINNFLLRFKSVNCIDLENFPLRKIATLKKILMLPYTPKSLKMRTTYRYAGLDNTSVEIHLRNMNREDKLRKLVIDKCREDHMNLTYCIGMGLHQRFNFQDLNK